MLPFEQATWPTLLVAILWAAIVLASVVAYRPVQSLPEGAPADRFSAERAEPILQMLVGDSIPHPAGSVQNKVVRQRLIKLLESFGYEVEIQSGSMPVNPKVKRRSPDRDEVELHNLIAKRPASDARKLGQESGGDDPPLAAPILLVAHYDSVPTGPGAADDGIGMAAVVEIARMLASEPPLQREVIFLLTDGEEFGLLGAKLFCQEHPLAQLPAIAINLESRGTAGPSLMFETSGMTRSLVPLFAESSRKPLASSLFIEIYKRLPNDTDFTVFKQQGMLGFNFAIIGDVRNYHTPLDNIDVVSRDSWQHHGENALGLIRAIASDQQLDKDLQSHRANLAGTERSARATEVVYFDLFGLLLVWWPNSCSMWMTLLAAVALVIGMTRRVNLAVRDRDAAAEVQVAVERRWWSWLLAALAITLSLLAIVALGYFFKASIAADPRLANPWPKYPTSLLLCCWAAGFALIAGVVRVFPAALEPNRTLMIVVFAWFVLAAVTSYSLPGASFLFVLPTLAASLCYALTRRSLWPIVVLALAVGLLWLPLERLFYDAVGLRMLPFNFVRIAIVGSSWLALVSLLPNRAKFSLAIGLAVLAAACMGGAMWQNSEAPPKRAALLCPTIHDVAACGPCGVSEPRCEWRGPRLLKLQSYRIKAT